MKHNILETVIVSVSHSLSSSNEELLFNEEPLSLEQSCAERHAFPRLPPLLLPGSQPLTRPLRKTCSPWRAGGSHGPHRGPPPGVCRMTYFEGRARRVAHVGQDLNGLLEHDPECAGAPITTEASVILAQGLLFFILNDLRCLKEK